MLTYSDSIKRDDAKLKDNIQAFQNGHLQDYLRISSNTPPDPNDTTS